MKTPKFIKAPNSSTIILNPDWIKKNYPKTWDLIYREGFENGIDNYLMRQNYRNMED